MGAFSLSDITFLAQDAIRPGARASGIENRGSIPDPRSPISDLHQAAEAFEQVLLGMMMEAMREAIPDSGLLPKLPGHELYQQMLDQEYLRTAGDRGLNLGVAEAMERQFADFVEGQESPSGPDTTILTKGGQTGT
jgi:Rod binding domain-containing protein